MNAPELKQILDLHKKWLNGEAGGKKADLSSANLRSANLSYADLHSANLHSADLSSANLRSANLSYADLHSADLTSANLSSADLRYANLSSANLSYADLHSANLHSANLRYANLHSADLSSANLHSANLRSANLHSANLRYAYLYDAILRDVRLSGAKMEGVHHAAIEILKTKNLDALIARATAKKRALNMSDWHTCKTTHCRAGWAVVIAGAKAQGIEVILGTPATAALVYAASRPNKPIPDFYSSNQLARASIVEDAKAEKSAAKKKTAKATRA